MEKDDTCEDTPQESTRERRQQRRFKFLSHAEFHALPECDKAPYINSAILELGKMDPTRKAS